MPDTCLTCRFSTPHNAETVHCNKGVPDHEVRRVKEGTQQDNSVNVPRVVFKDGNCSEWKIIPPE